MSKRHILETNKKPANNGSKKYWKGIEELNAGPELDTLKNEEFPENIVMGELADDNIMEAATSRRDFLKLMGFSLTAATVAASCEIPVKKAIPYFIKPEEITPGTATWYASTLTDSDDYCSILVKTREGRPIKIEGNDKSSITQGGTSARTQAAVLSLYDVNRQNGPTNKGEGISWDKADSEIVSKLADISASGGTILIISSTIISPSTKSVINDFISKYPTAKHITNDAISASGMLMANKECFETEVVPAYYFDKAKVIVSIGADFLGTWISPIEFTKQYVTGRRVTKEVPKMSKHYQVEANMSLTGSNADERYVVKPSQYGSALTSLYNAIAKLAGRALLTNSKTELDKSAVNKMAKDLWANKGASLVVCGSNNVDIQIMVNGINHLLENYGTTINLNLHSNLKQGNDAEMQDAISSMNKGGVAAVILYDVNPVYDMPNGDKFATGLKKVKLSVSFSDRLDETSSLVQYVCPNHHALESWNDAEPRTGVYSLAQPTISPLFDTRAAQESLMRWGGTDQPNFYKYIQQYWQDNIYTKQSKYILFQDFWDNCLHDGVFEIKLIRKNQPQFTGDLSAASNDISKVTKATGKGVELILYEKVGLGNGRHANNPWLQEMPDPITKVTWDNYALVSLPFALEHKLISKNKDKQIEDIDRTEVTVKLNGTTLTLPVVVQPGQANNTVAIALGYGRTKVGKAGDNVGQNAYPFASFNGQTMQYHQGGVMVEKTGKTHLVAQTQMHFHINEAGVDAEDGRDIVRESTLKEYKKDPFAGNEKRRDPKKNEKLRETSLYKFGMEHKSPGHHWGMTIDTNVCIGCSACTIACQAENNISVVGKLEVARKHEMSWIRIDRYYGHDVDSPTVIFQPMLCQHCDNAPCENVCPVQATTHSQEGLNQMIYNRCIGTRYCANNCPYKVRRFNWFDYTSQDSFGKGTFFDNEHDPLGMMEDLTRMVLNPDVTIRSRGVMEKCTFCVQRIQESKLEAKKESKKLADGAIKTACAQACPTNAITFGDVNDSESAVSESRKNERFYYVIEEVHTLPSVGYLTKVRNKDSKAT